MLANIIKNRVRKFLEFGSMKLRKMLKMMREKNIMMIFLLRVFVGLI